MPLNEADTSDTEALYLDLQLFCFRQYFDKRDDFDFDMVNLSFLDGDVPHRPTYGVQISQLIRFACVCSHVDDFNARKNV